MSEKQSKGERVFVIILFYLFNFWMILGFSRLFFQVLEVDFTVHKWDVVLLCFGVDTFITMLFVKLDDIISHLEDLKKGEDNGSEV